MPAAIAHMVAANIAARALEGKQLKLPTLVLNKFPQWLQAGAVGPDYPYLHHVIAKGDPSENWANHLHYEKTGDVVRVGVRLMMEQFLSDRNTPEFHRALAWLYGYSSHVVLDASIHPVVRAIVGEYEDNPTEHRACEMYMDSYIYKNVYKTELNNTEWCDYLRSLTDKKTKLMDSSVVKLWDAMLSEVYPEYYPLTPPQIFEWHKSYILKIDAADINLWFFRHFASEKGVIYLEFNEIKDEDKSKYIDNLLLPKQNRFGKTTMQYLEVFNFGVENVTRFWELITAAVEGRGDPAIPTLPNWNLDKGTIDPKGEGDATLWV